MFAHPNRNYQQPFADVNAVLNTRFVQQNAPDRVGVLQ